MIYYVETPGVEPHSQICIKGYGTYSQYISLNQYCRSETIFPHPEPSYQAISDGDLFQIWPFYLKLFVDFSLFRSKYNFQKLKFKFAGSVPKNEFKLSMGRLMWFDRFLTNEFVAQNRFLTRRRHKNRFLRPIKETTSTMGLSPDYKEDELVPLHHAFLWSKVFLTWSLREAFVFFQ